MKYTQKYIQKKKGQQEKREKQEGDGRRHFGGKHRLEGLEEKEEKNGKDKGKS